MPEESSHRKRCRRFNIPGDAHHLTFSCYDRLPLLAKDRTRQWLADALEKACEKQNIALWAYVFMPEHVHLLMNPRSPSYDISGFLFAVKRPVAGRARRFLERHARKTVSGNGAETYRLTLENPKLGDTTFVFRKTDWADAIRRVKRGKTGVIMRQAGSETTYHFDPANPEAQLTYLKVSKLVGGKSNADALPDASGTAIRENIEPLSVTGTRYIDFLVPGLISMGLMMSCMWGISYGTIEKRSKKLLRRMVATPMKKAYFLIALMIVRVTMNIIEATLLFFFAWLVFDISVQGSLGALAAIFLAGNIAFGGLAILTASHTANTEIGNGLINAVVLPLTILSGIFFSYHNFPDWSIPVIQKLPLALLADGIRSIFIEGAGWPETAMPILLLTAMGAAFFSLGLKVFKWH